ncbi:response regulator [Candidatus Woesearchaeota archaeon]|nr:response regulator [Candidatus Woesearchaeota archaeon]
MTKILIVDDSAFIRAVLKDILMKGGYKQIVEGESGEDAIKLYKKEKPDIVLLDIVMKDSGLAALQKIMKIDSLAKVIMISATGQKETIDDALRAGAKQYVGKPFEPKKVIETIKKVLK